MAEKNAVPVAARTLAHDAIDAGWSVAYNLGVDTGMNQFVTVEASRPAAGEDSDPSYFRVTWHTRGTGTFRMFDCCAGKYRYQASACSLRHIKSLVERIDHG